MKPTGPTLVTPNMLMKSKDPDLQPLNQQQLVQALKYLLENDSDFLRKVHDAYMKNFERKN